MMKSDFVVEIVMTGTTPYGLRIAEAVRALGKRLVIGLEAS